MKKKLVVGRVHFTPSDSTFYLPAGYNENLTKKYEAPTPEESEELLKNDGYVLFSLFKEDFNYAKGKKTWCLKDGSFDDYIATWVIEES